MRKGICFVTADILHAGHIIFINQCRKMCDHLTVGIMSDKCIKKYKGEYPIMPEKQRMLIVGNLKSVDDFFLQKTFDISDWTGSDDYIVFDSMEHQREGANCYIPYTIGISSSQIKENIIASSQSRKR